MAGAAAELVLWCGTVATSGPLAPNGWLTYTLYPALAVWLVPTTILMMRKPKVSPIPPKDVGPSKWSEGRMDGGAPAHRFEG